MTSATTDTKQYISEDKQQCLPFSQITEKRELDRESKKALKKLIIISLVDVIFITIELIGGLWANSLGILTDAAHLSTDLFGFCISIFAICLSRSQANNKFTYGYHRAQTLAALGNTILIWILALYFVVEAINRIRHPKEINGNVMLITSIFGVICNIIMVVVLHDHHDHDHSHQDNHNEIQNFNQQITDLDLQIQTDDSQDQILPGKSEEDGIQIKNNLGVTLLDSEEDPSNSDQNSNKASNQQASIAKNVNVRAALVHIIGDLAQSLMVMIAGIIVQFYPEATIADPIASFVFVCIVFGTGYQIVKDSVKIQMQSSPNSLSLEHMKDKLKTIKNVKEIAELHIWSLTDGKPVLSAHLKINDINNYKKVLDQAKIVAKSFEIANSTFEIDQFTD